MPNCTSRSGAANGRGRNSTLFATLNMAVVAPMPRAMISNAVTVRVGVLRSDRVAYRISPMIGDLSSQHDLKSGNGVPATQEAF